MTGQCPTVQPASLLLLQWQVRETETISNRRQSCSAGQRSQSIYLYLRGVIILQEAHVHIANLSENVSFGPAEAEREMLPLCVYRPDSGQWVELLVPVELSREGSQAVWGFRLRGGTDVDGGTPLEIIRVGMIRKFLREKQQYVGGHCGGSQRGTAPGWRQNSQHQQFQRPVHLTLRGSTSVQVSWREMVF